MLLASRRGIPSRTPLAEGLGGGDDIEGGEWHDAAGVETRGERAAASKTISPTARLRRPAELVGVTPRAGGEGARELVKMSGSDTWGRRG